MTTAAVTQEFPELSEVVVIFTIAALKISLVLSFFFQKVKCFNASTCIHINPYVLLGHAGSA